MSYILTFVASPGNPDVTEKHLRACGDIFHFYNMDKPGASAWLEKKRAVDVEVSDRPQGALLAHIKSLLEKDKIDLFATPTENRRKKILIADMDATIVEGETLDELADHAGLKNEVAAITQKAMEGKLDFHAALRERVALLKDLPREKLQQTLDKMKLNPGAKTLVRTMRNHGAITVLVTGGFTFFSEEIAERAGFAFHHANEFLWDGGLLTGKVKEPVLDKHTKLGFLEEYARKNNLTNADALSIGDGANDLPMLKSAGLGIGYRPKPLVQEEMPNCILYGDLIAALYAQGYKHSEFTA